jgi:hypothetical protein
VVETSIREAFSVIHPFVQTNNGSNVVSLKIWNVSLRRMLVVAYIKKHTRSREMQKENHHSVTRRRMETVSGPFDCNCKNQNF